MNPEPVLLLHPARVCAFTVFNGASVYVRCVNKRRSRKEEDGDEEYK